MRQAAKRVFPVWFTMVVTLVFIAATSAVYSTTKEKIKQNENLRFIKSVLLAAGIAVPPKASDVEKLFSERVKEIKDNDGKTKYFVIYNEDRSSLNSYVLVRKGTGLWGTITATVGVKSDLTSFAGLEIVDQNETPGLGGRITEQWFMDQFKGKKSPLTTVPEGNPAGENQFQAITGATYSTNGIKDLMNGASKYALDTIAAQKE
jgi:Na+-transporting NADH:ubiquinone oxidoreductase subunit C